MKIQLSKLLLLTICWIIFSFQMTNGQHWLGEEDPRVPIWREGKVGIGFSEDVPLSEMLEVVGGIKLGNTTNAGVGTIRWNGTKFEGRTSSGWNSLMGYWEKTGFEDDIFHYGRVGIGTMPNLAKLSIQVGDPYDPWNGGIGLLVELPQLQYSSSFMIQSSEGFKMKSDDGYSFYNSNGTNLRLRIDNDGNVGIGTSLPQAKLDVSGAIKASGNISTHNAGIRLSADIPQGGGSQSSIDQTQVGLTLISDDGYSFYDPTGSEIKLRIKPFGNIGIGVLNPTSRLEVDGTTFINTSSPSTELFKIAANTTENQPVVKAGINSLSGYLSLGRFSSHGGDPDGEEGSVVERIVLNAMPNGVSYLNGTSGLAIGKITISTGFKLDVNGKIRANEIVVNTTGADFVFEEDYNLRTLSEVEAFIKENKHLPEIPTAKEVEENGVSLGEMQSKLLQKIEELTLYIIEQEKRIKKLESR